MSPLRRLGILAFYHLGGVAFCRWLFRRDCTVLTYHGVIPPGPAASDDRQKKFVFEPDFIRQLDYIRRHYTPVTLARFEESLHGGPPLPPRALLITCDDGYQNNVSSMAPHLASRGLPAVVFLTAGFIDTPRILWPNRVEMWWSSRSTGVDSPDRPSSMGEMKGRLKSLPRTERDALLDRWIGTASAEVPSGHVFRMMTWDEARRLESMGIAAGSHTMSHAILAQEDEACAEREISESRRVLQDELGHPVTSFAYPNGGRGYFLPRDEALLQRSGYRVGFAAIRGRHRPGADPYAVRRIPVSRVEGWLPLFAARLAFPYGLKDGFLRLVGRR